MEDVRKAPHRVWRRSLIVVAVVKEPGLRADARALCRLLPA